MEVLKVFNNNIGVFNEILLYYHGHERMVGDKKLKQGNIVHMPKPKVVLPIFIIEYNLNHVLCLEAEK